MPTQSIGRFPCQTRQRILKHGQLLEITTPIPGSSNANLHQTSNKCIATRSKKLRVAMHLFLVAMPLLLVASSPSSTFRAAQAPKIARSSMTRASRCRQVSSAVPSSRLGQSTCGRTGVRTRGQVGSVDGWTGGETSWQCTWHGETSKSNLD